jgi:hypothetical protein
VRSEEECHAAKAEVTAASASSACVDLRVGEQVTHPLNIDEQLGAARELK